MILSTTISVLSAFAISASASNDILGETNTHVLKKAKTSKTWSNKALKKSKTWSNKASKKSPKVIKDSETCKDPLAAIMQTLQCVADKDIPCASMGYATGFQKIHNGIDTGLDFGDDPAAFWQFALQMISISLDFNHEVNVGPNMASIRYIEGVQFTDGTAYGLPASEDYPFSTYYVQHEHALVTVNDDCKMTKWDQYGDNIEQNDVDNASGAVVGVLCTANMFPPEACVALGIGPE